VGGARGGVHTTKAPLLNTLGSQIIRQIVLPLLEKEINEGKNFAQLRQVYSGVILANWYKRALKQALVNQVYANSKKVNGIDIADKSSKEKIYNQYLQAYKKGVYNYIKEDVGILFSGESMPRKYFSGGCKIGAAMISKVVTAQEITPVQIKTVTGAKHPVVVPFLVVNAKSTAPAARAAVGSRAQKSDAATLSLEERRLKNARLANQQRVSGVSVDNEEGFSQKYPSIANDQRGIQSELEGHLTEEHQELLQGMPSGIMYRTQEAAEKANRMIQLIEEGKYDHIVIITDQDPVLAKAHLQSATKTSEWNNFLKKKGKPQIHFIDSNDPVAIQRLGVLQAGKYLALELFLLGHLVIKKFKNL